MYVYSNIDILYIINIEFLFKGKHNISTAVQRCVYVKQRGHSRDNRYEITAIFFPRIYIFFFVLFYCVTLFFCLFSVFVLLCRLLGYIIILLLRELGINV